MKIQLTMFCIYNCRVIFLSTVILSYRNNKYLQCYHFTYSQYSILIRFSSHLIKSSHLRISFFMNWESSRIIKKKHEMAYISCSKYKWKKSVIILNILKYYLSCDSRKMELILYSTFYTVLYLFHHMLLLFHYPMYKWRNP